MSFFIIKFSIGIDLVRANLLLQFTGYLVESDSH